MKIKYFLSFLLFFSVFCPSVKAEKIYVLPPNAKEVGYTLEKNESGLWHKQMFFPIKNFLTKDIYTYNIEKNMWEKQIKKKDIFINPIFRINQDGSKVITYDLGHKWFKVTTNDDYLSNNIIACFNQNDETITYLLNNVDLRNIKEVSLFDITGKELFTTDEIQAYGIINVPNISTNVILICFKLNTNYITKKVIIY